MNTIKGPPQHPSLCLLWESQGQDSPVGPFTNCHLLRRSQSRNPNSPKCSGLRPLQPFPPAFLAAQVRGPGSCHSKRSWHIHAVTKEVDAVSCLLLCTWMYIEGSPCFHAFCSTLTPVWVSRGQGPGCPSTTGPDSLSMPKPHSHLDSSHTSSVVSFVSGQPGFPNGAIPHRHCPGEEQ